MSATLLSIAVLTVGILAINMVARSAGPAAAAAKGVPVVDTARLNPNAASRDYVRPSSGPTNLLESVPSPTAAPPAEPPAVRVKPVAGLTQAMMDHAVTIVRVGQERKLPRRAALVAMVTALQETHLRNFANTTVAASLKLPHEGAERNFDSVGLFQQRPSQGWGPVADLMDPATAAGLFYDRLVRVKGWETMSVGAAAQAVQRSAFPTAYDKQQAKATTIVEAIL
jgi:hypothetical protein